MGDLSDLQAMREYLALPHNPAPPIPVNRYRISVRYDVDFIVLATDPLSANRQIDLMDIRSGQVMDSEIINTREY